MIGRLLPEEGKREKNPAATHILPLLSSLALYANYRVSDGLETYMTLPGSYTFSNPYLDPIPFE